MNSLGVEACSSETSRVEEKIFDLGFQMQKETSDELTKQMKELIVLEGLPLSKNVSNMLFNLNIIKVDDKKELLDLSLNREGKCLNVENVHHWVEKKMESDRNQMSQYLIKPKKGLSEEAIDQFERVRYGSICLMKVIEQVDIELHEWISSLNDFEAFKNWYGEFTCDHFLPKLKHDKNILKLILDLYWREEYYTCFAVGITYLERTLGDIWIIPQNTSEDPSKIAEFFRELKINELLMTDEVEKQLGAEFVFLFRCFSGPLQGLNLRNITWHGFLDSTHFPRSVASFLIHLIISLSQKENIKQILETAESKSLRRSLNDVFDIPDQSGNFLRTMLSDYIREGPSVPTEMHRLIDDSFFIPHRSKNDWKMSMKYYREGENYLSLVLLFPHLEHAMRRLFAYLNNNFNRLFSAETDQLYTTFDEILHPSIESSTTSLGEQESSVWTYENRNKLIEHVGDNLVVALYDILFFKEGPRLRDKLSHGVVDPSDVNGLKNMCEQVVAIALSLAFKYSTLLKFDSTIGCEGELFQKIAQVSEQFILPIYHPQMTLLKEMELSLEKFKSFIDNAFVKSYQYRYFNDFTKQLFLKTEMERGEKRFIVEQSSDLVEMIEMYKNRLKSNLNHESFIYKHLLEENSAFLNTFQAGTEPLDGYNIRNVIHALKELSGTTLRPRHPKTFCGNPANTQSVEFTKIIRLADIARNAGLVMDEVIQTLKEVAESVLNRTAFKKQRKRLVKICMNMYDFYHLFILFMMAIEFLYLIDLDPKTLSERSIVLRLSSASPSSVKNTTYEKIEKLNNELKKFTEKFRQP